MWYQRVVHYLDSIFSLLCIGYGWLEWVVRVQSVTWVAIVGCPCDWWWLVVLFTLVTLPPYGFPPTRNELAPRS